MPDGSRIGRALPHSHLCTFPITLPGYSRGSPVRLLESVAEGPVAACAVCGGGGYDLPALIMSALFLFIPFVLMMTLWRDRVQDWRDRFLVASVVWGTLAVVITEVLSLLDSIYPRALVLAWSAAAALVMAMSPLVPRLRRTNVETEPLTPPHK